MSRRAQGIARGPRRITLAVSVLVAAGYIGFGRPADGLNARVVRLSSMTARPAPDAFGRSGQLRMRFALPGEPVEYPLEIQTGLSDLRYRWVALGDTMAGELDRPLDEGLFAPDKPGFYSLELSLEHEHQLMDALPLAVLVPKSEKTGSTLNGYRMGFYRGERARRTDPEAPIGFVEIDTIHMGLPLSEHLVMADFLTHDNQSTWPRYAAVDPRLIDKIELVLAEIGTWTGGATRDDVRFDVRSGFRTPLHNRLVPAAARDSRHQLGDAIDLSVDANRDGRVNAKDATLVSMAVEIVERLHPDLVGGMGIYARTGRAYVHIDARGKRVRWRG